jgi:predicted aconitase with swiveling domain
LIPITLTARHAMGAKVTGVALVANDGFSARYDLNRLQGVFSRPAHKLVGQSYVGKILVLDTAKGGVATAWMLHEMQSRHMAPLAIVFNSVNTILAQGAALGGITMLAGFDIDVTALVPSGATLELDPQTKTLRVVESPASVPSEAGDRRVVHGPK